MVPKNAALVRRPTLRLCPLLQSALNCSRERPLCNWCGHLEQAAPAAVAVAAPAGAGKPQKVCVQCGELFDAGSNRAERCGRCATEHNRKENAKFQREFRARKVKHGAKATIE